MLPCLQTPPHRKECTLYFQRTGRQSCPGSARRAPLQRAAWARRIALWSMHAPHLLQRLQGAPLMAEPMHAWMDACMWRARLTQEGADVGVDVKGNGVGHDVRGVQEEGEDAQVPAGAEARVRVHGAPKAHAQHLPQRGHALQPHMANGTWRMEERACARPQNASGGGQRPVPPATRICAPPLTPARARMSFAAASASQGR